jgi:hypothetical protein
MSPRRSNLSLNQKITISLAFLAILASILAAFISGHDWFPDKTSSELGTTTTPNHQLATPLVFDSFNTSQGFQSTGPQVRISQGSIFWNVSRSDGDQFLYREIPTFKGNVRLTVLGQIDDWTNNCRGGVGIGDKPGSGIAVYFGYYGGGCPSSSAVVTASGATFDMQEDPQCTFVGDWLRINPQTPTQVKLTTDDSSAELAVEGIGTAIGTVDYHGYFSTLWIGLSGDGDQPSCSGKIDSITIEPIQ